MEPRGIQRRVIWDALQLHWNACAHTLQLIETVQATQHVNAEASARRLQFAKRTLCVRIGLTIRCWLRMMRQSVDREK